jgi:hypothetical protein
LSLSVRETHRIEEQGDQLLSTMFHVWLRESFRVVSPRDTVVIRQQLPFLNLIKDFKA